MSRLNRPDNSLVLLDASGRTSYLYFEQNAFFDEQKFRSDRWRQNVKEQAHGHIRCTIWQHLSDFILESLNMYTCWWLHHVFMH